MSLQNFAAQLFRQGGEAEVKVRVEGNTNDFGNPTDSYVSDRTVIAARTYPNRNTEINSDAGDRHKDRPVFMVPTGPDQNAPPAEEDHLVYDGQEYEVGSHTDWGSHIEFFGSPVLHDEAGK
jgi:hypothetical protein